MASVTITLYFRVTLLGRLVGAWARTLGLLGWMHLPVYGLAMRLESWVRRNAGKLYRVRRG